MNFSNSGVATINTGTIAKFDCELMHSVGLNVIALPSKQTVNVGIQKDGTLICQVGGSSTNGSFVGSFATLKLQYLFQKVKNHCHSISHIFL